MNITNPFQSKINGNSHTSYSTNPSQKWVKLLVGTVVAVLSILPQPISSESHKPESGKKNNRQKEMLAEVISGSYNVKEFGAAGDGKTLDMEAINNTIEACSERGGGTVLFPAGVYLTGTIQLKSNITLLLDAGATILGSKNLDDYEEITDPVDKRDAEKWHIGLIEGQRLQNVAITGRGTIDGNKVTNPEGEENYRGPNGIIFSRCEGLLVEDIFIRDPGNYGFQIEGCSNGNICGVTVTGGSDAINMSKISDFIITECHFLTGDDCLGGGEWENVVVSNSVFNTSCSGMRNGRGGLKNVIFTNLIIQGPGKHPHIVSDRHDLLAGFLIHKSGVVDNLVISNVTITNARCPLWLGSRAQDVPMRNISISNLTATMVGMPGYLASVITGTPESPVENISLNDVTIISRGGGTEDLIDQPVPPLVRDPYITIPCYGLFCRDIKDLELNNLRFSYMKEDARPAIICESIDRLELDGVRAQPGTGSTPAIILKDIKKLIECDTDQLTEISTTLNQ